jgi:hypothetical protein
MRSALLWDFYTAQSGSFVLMFWDNLLVIFKSEAVCFLDCLTLEDDQYVVVKHRYETLTLCCVKSLAAQISILLYFLPLHARNSFFLHLRSLVVGTTVTQEAGIVELGFHLQFSVLYFTEESESATSSL